MNRKRLRCNCGSLTFAVQFSPLQSEFSNRLTLTCVRCGNEVPAGIVCLQDILEEAEGIMLEEEGEE